MTMTTIYTDGIYRVDRDDKHVLHIMCRTETLGEVHHLGRDREAEQEELARAWASAMAMKESLSNCRGAMQSMRDQIDQMKGMFPDDDGAIERSCEDHDHADEEAGEILERVRTKIRAPRSEEDSGPSL